MKSSTRIIQKSIAAAILALGAFAGQAQAQVNVHIDISPPGPRYEAVPVLRPGYVWAPGYWAWQGNNYAWVRGRQMQQRAGHRWVADHYEPGNRYRAGYWEPERRHEDYRHEEHRREEHRRDDRDRHEDHDGRRDHDNGRGFCPPGQAKKGNC
jgi:hypothetical protein